MTSKFANQILMDILSSENDSDSTLLKYSKNIKSNIRTHAKYLQHGDVFSKVGGSKDLISGDGKRKSKLLFAKLLG
jgi:hypothetical protein